MATGLLRHLVFRTHWCDGLSKVKYLNLYSALSGYMQWCSGQFGTVGMLAGRLPLFSPSCLSPPLLSLLSPTLPSPPLSGGNNFNDFPENQLTTDFAFLCKPAWGNATVSPVPFVLISFGGTAFPHKIFGGTAFPSTTALATPRKRSYI